MPCRHGPKVVRVSDTKMWHGIELLGFSPVSSHAVGGLRMPHRAVNISQIGQSANMVGDTGYQLLVDDGPYLVGVQHVRVRPGKRTGYCMGLGQVGGDRPP